MSTTPSVTDSEFPCGRTAATELAKMSSGAKRAMLSEIDESRMDANKVQPAKTAMAPAV